MFQDVDDDNDDETPSSKDVENSDDDDDNVALASLVALSSMKACVSFVCSASLQCFYWKHFVAGNSFQESVRQKGTTRQGLQGEVETEEERFSEGMRLPFYTHVYSLYMSHFQSPAVFNAKEEGEDRSGLFVRCVWHVCYILHSYLCRQKKPWIV